MPARVEPGLLRLHAGPLGSRFYLWTTPAEVAPRGVVVYAHPFAEEMNKARRMAAWQARAFAEAGFAVLQIDQLGCGDSDGDWGDTSWERWVDDIVAACRWALDRHRQSSAGTPELWLWGLRSGCLLAAQAAPRLDRRCDFLFWQPVVSGKTALQQFLRLDSIGSRLSGGAPAPSARETLAAGREAVVAGYRLPPALASGLDAARLQPPPAAGRVEWFEWTAQPQAEASPAARQSQAIWQAAGFVVRHHRLVGPPFWQTTEIEDAPALVDASVAALLAPADAIPAPAREAA